MFKVNNIIPLWRVVIPNMYQSHVLNLVMSIESSNVEQRCCELRRCSQNVTKCRTNDIFCSRVLDKGIEPELKGDCSRAP